MATFGIDLESQKLHSFLFASSHFHPWPPSESTSAPPTPASESGRTKLSKSSPTTRATVPPLLTSLSLIPTASSATPQKTKSPGTPSTPSSMPSV
ncbi:hypothetical protein P8452_49538 [Trifolium repens]|nr:hypothetical protein P8452_49538 [Trifolium repens]